MQRLCSLRLINERFDVRRNLIYGCVPRRTRVRLKAMRKHGIPRVQLVRVDHPVPVVQRPPLDGGWRATRVRYDNRQDVLGEAVRFKRRSPFSCIDRG